MRINEFFMEKFICKSLLRSGVILIFEIPSKNKQAARFEKALAVQVGHGDFDEKIIRNSRSINNHRLYNS